jgi:hypothetical protein
MGQNYGFDARSGIARIQLGMNCHHLVIWRPDRRLIQLDGQLRRCLVDLDLHRLFGSSSAVAFLGSVADRTYSVLVQHDWRRIGMPSILTA